jgi:hypothetical protein
MAYMRDYNSENAADRVRRRGVTELLRDGERSYEWSKELTAADRLQGHFKGDKQVWAVAEKLGLVDALERLGARREEVCA